MDFKIQMYHSIVSSWDVELYKCTYENHTGAYIDPCHGGSYTVRIYGI